MNNVEDPHKKRAHTFKPRVIKWGPFGGEWNLMQMYGWVFEGCPVWYMFWVGRVMTPLEPPEIKGSWFQTCWKKHPNSTQGVPKLFEIPWMWDRSSVFNRGHFPWDLFWGGMKLHANFYGNFDLKKFPHHRCIVWVGVIFHDPCLTGVRCPSTTTPENPMGFLKTTETTDQSESESESSQRSDASSDLRWLPSLRVDFFLVVFFRGMTRSGGFGRKKEKRTIVGI